MKRRTAILISGRGSNMEALIEAARHPAFPAEIRLVISNRPDAPGLTAARLHGVCAEVVDHRDFVPHWGGHVDRGAPDRGILDRDVAAWRPHVEKAARVDRGAHEAAIDKMLRAAGIEIVCLAGYLRRLTPVLVGPWQGRMLNIHPSLLPLFPGLNTHARALEAGVKLHGCTVHLVTQEVDAGPILAQAAVPVLPGDTADTLGRRVLRQEHAIYPAALAAFASGISTGLPGPDQSLANPLGCTPHAVGA